MTAISRYPVPELNNLPDDLRERILGVQEKAGFVPNVFLALAHRPAEWRAFFAYHDALMVPESAGRTSGLSKGEREMIVTTTSAANQCLYCVVAHGAILRIYEKKPLLADQVAVNWRKAEIPPRQRAMLEFALKACERSHEVDEAEDGNSALEKLRSKSYGLVISDWNMEPMTGLDLLKQVRSDDKLKKLPFIMVTAESKTENVIAAKAAGVSNYIVKPFNAETLKGKIDAVFEDVSVAERTAATTKLVLPA